LLFTKRTHNFAAVLRLLLPAERFGEMAREAALGQER